MLGYEYRGTRSGSDSAFDKCTDRLTLQRWIAWPLAIIGACLVVRGVVNRRNSAATSAQTNTGQPAAGLPQPSGGSQDPPARRPFPHASQLPPPSGSALQIPQLTPPSWYQCSTNSGLIRWYDGRQWTETTQPHPDQQ